MRFSVDKYIRLTACVFDVGLFNDITGVTGIVKMTYFMGINVYTNQLCQRKKF